MPRDQQRSDVAVAPTMMKKVCLYRRALAFWRFDTSLPLVICGLNKQSRSHAITRCDDVVSYLSNEISSSLNRARNTPKSTRPCQWRWRPGDGKKSELLRPSKWRWRPLRREKGQALATIEWEVETTVRRWVASFHYQPCSSGHIDRQRSLNQQPVLLAS